MTDLDEGIYFEFRRRQYDAMDKKRMGIFHVSDYVDTCARHAYYMHMKSEPSSGMDTRLLSVFFAGESVHHLMDKLKVPEDRGLTETPLMWNFVDDEPVEMDEISKATTTDWLKILVGEFDAMYIIDGKPVIVDYKTWLSRGYKKRAVDPAHKEQVQMYAYLAKKVLGLEVKDGAVIYMDFADRLEKPDIYRFKIGSLDKVEEKIKARYGQFAKAYESGWLPERTLGWKCNGYCSFTERCAKEDQIDVEEADLEAIV